tara:strand:- start:52261 stop:53325 length:1065 start_codon:yes stop_codon:yes gene_type:complete
MEDQIKKLTHKSGQEPGEVVFIGKRKIDDARIEVLDYTPYNLKEKVCPKVEDCFIFKNRSTVTWLNVSGVHETEVIEKIGKHYGLHPLVLEDIANTHQRPKVEDFDNYIFIILKLFFYDEKTHEIDTEQVSLVLGYNWVISFEEKEGSVFENVRKRIRNSKGKLRKNGADHLAYSLLDSVVDNYFSVLETVGERIEEIEEEVTNNPDPIVLNTIHKLKRGLTSIRKSVWPLRDILNNLLRQDSSLIHRGTKVYLRDVYDHSIQAIDMVETFRDMVASMIDIYLTKSSNKMNEVMKVLTIIATIFIPLTFITGVYGMNFQYFPELTWKYGYAMFWTISLFISLVMLALFKKKKWL